jgi:hypothetical protein
MKKATWLLTAILVSMGLLTGFGAPAQTDVTGNWKGTLEIGQAKLRLVFKIARSPGGDLTAKLDSLDQGARDIEVDTVTLKDKTLRLEVGSIKGVFEGTLTGTKITGQWQQGPSILPLTLERSQAGSAGVEAETLSPADLAASKLAAQKLAGIWNGTLDAGTASLRLKVKLTKTASGAATGTIDSLDQGAKDIPLSAVTYKEGKVRFEARGIGAYYEGTLAADGVALTGQWHQSGQSMPLDLKKAP